MKLLRNFVLVAVFPLLAGAATITSGTITFMRLIPSGTFDFSGPGFSASGGFGTLFGIWDLVDLNRGGGVPPGTTVGVNGVASTDEFGGGGSATVDGMVFNNVQWGTDNSSCLLRVVGGPPITLNAGPGTYQTTFTFSGQLCGGGITFPPPNCAQVTLLDLTGSGIVTVNFATFDGNLEFTTATYSFTVSEPSTWALVVVGVAAALVRHRVKSAQKSLPQP